MISKNNVTKITKRCKDLFKTEAVASGLNDAGQAKSVKTTVKGSVHVNDLVKLNEDLPCTCSLRRSGTGMTITLK